MHCVYYRPQCLHNGPDQVNSRLFSCPYRRMRCLALCPLAAPAASQAAGGLVGLLVRGSPMWLGWMGFQPRCRRPLCGAGLNMGRVWWATLVLLRVRDPPAGARPMGPMGRGGYGAFPIRWANLKLLVSLSSRAKMGQRRRWERALLRRLQLVECVRRVELVECVGHRPVLLTSVFSILVGLAGKASMVPPSFCHPRPQATGVAG